MTTTRRGLDAGHQFLRYQRAAKHRIRLIALLGRAVTCPACGRSFRRFADHRGRPNAKCPGCGALERHRLMHAFFDQRIDVASTQSALHFAPEPQISRHLQGAVAGRYVSVDLKPRYDAALDITALPFPDASFDFIVCCHVLEHILDDAHAMREISRVLQPGGHAIIQVPHVMTMETTDEDPDLTPAERAERYGQSDHLRMYGADLEDRLRDAGLRVDEVLASSLGPTATQRWAIPDDQALYDCTKP